MTTEIKSPMILNQNILKRFCRAFEEGYLRPIPIDEARALKKVTIDRIGGSEPQEDIEVALRFCKFFADDPIFQEEIQRLEKLLSPEVHIYGVTLPHN